MVSKGVSGQSSAILECKGWDVFSGVDFLCWGGRFWENVVAVVDVGGRVEGCEESEVYYALSGEEELEYGANGGRIPDR